MDEEQWTCPKCGFVNEYYAGYCISCSEIRPVEAAAPPTKDEGPRKFEPSFRPPSRPMSEPQPLPGPQPPLQFPPASTRRATGKRSPGRGLILLAIIAVSAIVGSIVANDSQDNWSDDFLDVGDYDLSDYEAGDGAFLSEVSLLANERDQLLAAHQQLWATWQAAGQKFSEVDQALLVDELLALQKKVAALPSGSSGGLIALSWDWSTAVNRLVLAEQALSREPTQVNLEAQVEAWREEADAYEALRERYPEIYVTDTTAE